MSEERERDTEKEENLALFALGKEGKYLEGKPPYESRMRRPEGAKDGRPLLHQNIRMGRLTTMGWGWRREKTAEKRWDDDFTVGRKTNNQNGEEQETNEKKKEEAKLGLGQRPPTKWAPPAPRWTRRARLGKRELKQTTKKRKEKKDI